MERLEGIIDCFTCVYFQPREDYPHNLGWCMKTSRIDLITRGKNNIILWCKDYKPKVIDWEYYRRHPQDVYKPKVSRGSYGKF